MPNITYNSVVSATGSPGNFDASVVWSAGATYTGNFQRVTDQVNGNLDSVNYGVSSFLSQHFAPNCIVSQHITNNAVVTVKISDSGVLEKAMNYETADGGARVWRTMKAGLKRCHIAEALTLGTAASATFQVSWSDGVFGDPTFTEAPTFVAQPLHETGSAYNIFEVYATSLTSESAGFYVNKNAVAATLTFNIEAEGF